MHSVKFRIFKFPTNKNLQPVRYYLPQMHSTILILLRFRVPFWFIPILRNLARTSPLCFRKTRTHFRSRTSSAVKCRFACENAKPADLHFENYYGPQRVLEWMIWPLPSFAQMRFTPVSNGNCWEQSFRDERALRLTFDFSVKRGIQRWAAWENKVNEMAKLRIYRRGSCPIMHPHFRDALSGGNVSLKTNVDESFINSDCIWSIESSRCYVVTKEINFVGWRFNSKFCECWLRIVAHGRLLRG